MSKFAAKFSVSSVGPGLDELRKLFDSVTVGKAYVVAGVTGDGATEERDGGMTHVKLALIHEFGCPEKQIPARPFIMPAFFEGKSTYQKMLQAVVRRSIVVGVAKGLEGAKEYMRGLGLIGLKMAADMKAFVVGGSPVPPPNAPVTLARKIAKGKWKKGEKPATDEFGRLADPSAKGAPRTLVDTGRMVGSITHEVRGAGVVG